MIYFTIGKILEESVDLKEFFKTNNKVAVAFSGGVDSSYLLYAAHEAGADVRAYYVRSQFQPAFEFEDACSIAKYTGVDMKVIEVDVLTYETVTSNPEDRCYHCKRVIMGNIIRQASLDGYSLVIDGTNASDDIDDRPGARALKEFGVRSPLRECGITKPEIRKLAKAAGLSVWDKPAYACLATRIPHGELITADKLKTTEKAESLLYEMGFRDFRVRMRGENALVQVTAAQYGEAMARRNDIASALGTMYGEVIIDDITR